MIRLGSDGPFGRPSGDVIRYLQDSGESDLSGVAHAPQESVPEPCPVAEFGPYRRRAKACLGDGMTQRQAPARLERQHPRERPGEAQEGHECGERGDHDAARREPAAVSELLCVRVDHDGRMLGAGAGVESQVCERRKRIAQHLRRLLAGVDHADSLGLGAREIFV